MPYEIRGNGDQWCVYKEGTDDSIGCHDTEAEANRQMAALYAAEPEAKMAIKFVANSDDTIEGIAMPFGGPFNGRDLEGESFTAKTDFALDWFAERPLLYEHGFDKDMGTSVVGRVKRWGIDEKVGVWFEAQLDKAHRYYEAIQKLIEQGKLFVSSGALSYMTERKETGEITRWPWVELSLTPRPANPMATLDFATAAKHFDDAGLKVMWSAVKENLDDKSHITVFAKAILETSLKEHADTVANMADSLVERTKDLCQRRSGEGRSLSIANKAGISESVAALKLAVEWLQSVIAEDASVGRTKDANNDADRARQLALAEAFIVLLPSN